MSTTALSSGMTMSRRTQRVRKRPLPRPGARSHRGTWGMAHTLVYMSQSGKLNAPSRAQARRMATISACAVGGTLVPTLCDNRAIADDHRAEWTAGIRAHFFECKRSRALHECLFGHHDLAFASIDVPTTEVASAGDPVEQKHPTSLTLTLARVP